MGYLAVKGMYEALVPICPELIDPELFFVVLIQHFFHDKHLTEILVRFRNEIDNPRISYLTLGEDIGDVLTQFQDLCDELYTDTKRVTQSAIAETIKPLSSSESHLDCESELLVGLRLAGTTLNFAWPKLMEHRQEFRFSFQRVMIRLTQNGDATVLDSDGGEEIDRIETVLGCRPTCWPEGAPPYVEFEGSIEAVQLRDLETFVVCVLNTEGLVAVFDCRSGQWNSERLVKNFLTVCHPQLPWKVRCMLSRSGSREQKTEKELEKPLIIMKGKLAMLLITYTLR